MANVISQRKQGMTIEYQERGSHAVDVYEGRSRNLSRVNGKLLARALLFYVPNETLTPTRRRAIGNKDYRWQTILHIIDLNGLAVDTIARKEPQYTIIL